MDKKISELASASSIDAADVSLLVHNNTDYQYSFTTLLSYLNNNLSTGAAISFGTTLPQNTISKNGDVFVNTSAGTFAQKISGTWNVVYTLPSGSSQADGTVLYGLGIPANSTGNNNDTYINTTTGIFYKKTSGSWGQVFTMLNGPAGAKGDKGDKGDTGVSGRTILQGTSNPSNSTDGINGDFYINTAAYTLFGPKTGGLWGSGVNIVGPQGEKGDTGDTGPQGATGLKGDTGDTGPQGLTGAKGDTGDVGPTGVTGAKGDTGDTGPQGEKGDTGDEGPAGQGVPTGGTTSQVLAKVDGTDYNTEWADAAGGSSLYSADGTLSSNRTIDMDGKNLSLFGFEPFMSIISSRYGGDYGTHLGCHNTAEGQLILGNSGPNFIQGGTTGEGGSLEFWVNCTNGKGLSPDGIKAINLASNGAAVFADDVNVGGDLIVNGHTSFGNASFGDSAGGYALTIAGGGDSAIFQEISNNGGRSFIGHESSIASNGLLSGDSAFALCISTENERDICFGTNNTEKMTLFSGGNLSINHHPDDGINKLQVGGSVGISATQSTIPGSTSGSAKFTQPFQGETYKKVVIYCDALVGDASYTFPTVFTNQPVIITTNDLSFSLVTLLSTTIVTISGSNSTGYLLIEGY